MQQLYCWKRFFFQLFLVHIFLGFHKYTRGNLIFYPKLLPIWRISNRTFVFCFFSSCCLVNFIKFISLSSPFCQTVPIYVSVSDWNELWVIRRHFQRASKIELKGARILFTALFHSNDDFISVTTPVLFFKLSKTVNISNCIHLFIFHSYAIRMSIACSSPSHVNYKQSFSSAYSWALACI